jgi:hypothetical protein
MLRLRTKGRNEHREAQRMIPGKIAGFVESATVAMGGSRDANLVPHVHRISGLIVEPDHQTLTCLIAEGFTRDLLPSLEDNGQFALTVCDMPSHETYQLKGTYVGSRPLQDSDWAAHERLKRRFTERVSAEFGVPAEVLTPYVPPPSLAMSFAVREIFVQTPGPNAGRRIVPDEEG